MMTIKGSNIKFQLDAKYYIFNSNTEHLKGSYFY